MPELRFELVYDEVPASSNANTGVGGRGHPKAVARTKGRWEGIFAMLLLAQAHGIPRPADHVEVTARLKFRDKRRRDADNFYFPIAKPLGDALVKGGWLLDDTPEHYAFNRVEISPERLEVRSPLVKGQMRLELVVR